MSDRVGLSRKIHRTGMQYILNFSIDNQVETESGPEVFFGNLLVKLNVYEANKIATSHFGCVTPLYIR
jgi:hypothetical protein